MNTEPSSPVDPDAVRFAQRGGDPAPDSPRILSWQRRILGWGCAPAMAVGLISGLAGAARPELAQAMAMIGTGLAILVAGPITILTWRLRRDNARRWHEARARAADQGMEVRVLTTDEGDHEYRLEEIEKIAPIDWTARDGDGEQPSSAEPTEEPGSEA